MNSLFKKVLYMYIKDTLSMVYTCTLQSIILIRIAMYIMYSVLFTNVVHLFSRVHQFRVM